MSKVGQLEVRATKTLSFTPPLVDTLQRKCACGEYTGGRECSERRKIPEGLLQRRAANSNEPTTVPPIVHDVLRSPGQPLDPATLAFTEPRFGCDFSHVRVHTDAKAAESARAVNALAYTMGRDVVFSAGQYAPGTFDGRRLLAHELSHVVQQGQSEAAAGSIRQHRDVSTHESKADAVPDVAMAERSIGQIAVAPPSIQRRAAPYIKKVTVHLAPPQSADLQWHGTPPMDATGSDHFTISTGKGYSDPDDPPGTCTRTCCKDSMTQCAPPYNQPGKVGSCCTYFGSTFWTGTPESVHGGLGGWKFWTPIQPYYSVRGIALHQHTEVTGQPIGHGCVRMAEENARRIAEFSDGKRTNVTIDGRAAPVGCQASRRCAGVGMGGGRGGGAGLETEAGSERVVTLESAIPGLEGEMS